MAKKKEVTVAEWVESVQYGGIADYECFGYAVINGVRTRQMVVPSGRGKDVPDGATHIWVRR